MAATESAQAYPPIEPGRSGMLPVDDLHTLYWEESGNPDGVPVVFLHGGPGSGTVARHRQFFDPAYYRIVLFDQRGAGRSTPVGEWRQNTTQLLVSDIERLRAMLDIEDWLVFGGSWGSTLALAYAQSHPERCRALVLRGVFLCTAREIDWFLHGMAGFFPQAHARFAAAMPQAEQGDLLAAYGRRLFGADQELRLQAARDWRRYENSCLYLRAQSDDALDAGGDADALAVATLEAHYFCHAGFLAPDQLLLDAGKLAAIPTAIVQGRHDVICPPVSAWRLQQAMPHARLTMVEDAGHSAFEPGSEAALIGAMNRYRDGGDFGPSV